MKVVKQLNNNAAVCVDGKGRQLIALGRGVGFGETGHEVDLAKVRRTFYDVDPKYLQFVSEVEADVLEFAAQLADLARGQLSYELSPNLPVTLADHIQFAIKRAREHMVMPMPLDAEIRQSHPVEYRLGEMAVRGVQKTFGVRIDRHEASGVALFNVTTYVLGATNILGITGFVGGGTANLVWGCVASAAAFASAAAITFLFGFTKEELAADAEAAKA